MQQKAKTADTITLRAEMQYQEQNSKNIVRQYMTVQLKIKPNQNLPDTSAQITDIWAHI